MPFNKARRYLEELFKQRGEDLRTGKRLKWSTYEFDELKEQLKKFDRDSEHGEWENIHKSEQPDINQLMGVSNKIAWLCACARDIRTQFTAGASDLPRTSVDHVRFEVAYLEWKTKSLKRLKELNKQRQEQL